MFDTVQTARKNHGPCSMCRAAIRPGERYIRTAVPAWLNGEGDCDEEGMTRLILPPPDKRTWDISKYHVTCTAERDYAFPRGVDESQSDVQVGTTNRR